MALPYAPYVTSYDRIIDLDQTPLEPVAPTSFSNGFSQGFQ